MGETEAFAIGMALLAPAGIGRVELLTDRSDTWLMLCTFDELVKRMLPRNRAALLASGEGVNASPADDITQNMALSGVVTAWICDCLPIPALMLFLDNFLLKGRKIFYRYGLALLHRWFTHANHAALTVDDISRLASDPLELATEAFAYNFSSKDIAKSALIAHTAAWSLLTSSGKYLGVGERWQGAGGGGDAANAATTAAAAVTATPGHTAAFDGGVDTVADLGLTSRRMSSLSMGRVDMQLFEGGAESYPPDAWLRSASQSRRNLRGRMRSIMRAQFPLLHKQQPDRDELDFGPLEVERERLTLMKELGRGAFGTVHMATLQPCEGLRQQQGNSLIVAVKS